MIDITKATKNSKGVLCIASERAPGIVEERSTMNETNDCTVRALATAFGVSYKEAHTFAKEKLGRKNRDGIILFGTKLLKLGTIFGKNLEEIGDKCKYSLRTIPSTYYTKTRTVYNYETGKVEKVKEQVARQMTVHTFLKQYNKGTYIILVTGHTFTVKEGVVIGNVVDALQLRTRIYSAFKVV